MCFSTRQLWLLPGAACEHTCKQYRVGQCSNGVKCFVHVVLVRFMDDGWSASEHACDCHMQTSEHVPSTQKDIDLHRQVHIQSVTPHDSQHGGLGRS